MSKKISFLDQSIQDELNEKLHNSVENRRLSKFKKESDLAMSRQKSTDEKQLQGAGDFVDSNASGVREDTPLMVFKKLDSGMYIDEEDVSDITKTWRPPKKSIAVFNQSGFDVGDVFGFEGRPKLSQQRLTRRISLSKRLTQMLGVPILEDYDAKDLFENFPSYVAYMLMALSVILNSIAIPLFIMVPEITWARNGWRFFFQALVLIPFVLYEKRTGDKQIKERYKWEHCFKQQNITKIFLSAINSSLQTTIFIYFSQYNYIANSCLLGSMLNFWLAVTRSINNDKRHKIEFGGMMMCIVGLILIITYDSYSLTSDDLPPKLMLQYRFNDHYFKAPWMKVVLGIGVPVVVAIISTQLSLYTADLVDIYPPFLNLFLCAIFTSINLNMVGYFVFCTTVDATHFTGWFGFIWDGAFTYFFYLAVVINFGIFFCQVLISRLYEPIIPACVSLMEPPFISFFLDFFGLQYMPSSVSGLGYILIIPGQFIVILGYNIMENLRQYLLSKQRPHSTSIASMKKSIIRNTIDQKISDKK